MMSALLTVLMVALASCGTPTSSPENTSGESVPFERQPLKVATAKEISTALDDARTFLIRSQNRDGSWGSPRNAFGGEFYSPMPGTHYGVQAACTSLCIMALLKEAGQDPKAEAAVQKAAAWMEEGLSRVRRIKNDVLYNIWGHAYAVQALTRLRNRVPSTSAEAKLYERLIREQIERLERYSTIDGGWGYYDFNAQTKRPSGSPTSFTTATVMIAIDEARDAGIDALNPKIRKQALEAIRVQRNADGNFWYGRYFWGSPKAPINTTAGALGRNQVCHLGLFLWEDEKTSPETLSLWLEKLIHKNGWLSVGRKKPIPHESWQGVAGYFYYYGHFYAGEALPHMPTDDARRLSPLLAGILVPKQERDGSWWDFAFYDYHRFYSTPMTMMVLQHCQQVMSRP